MSFDLFINFDGECREALDFYAEIFHSEIQNLMTHGDMPPDPEYTAPEVDKDRVLYARIPIFGCNVMFCDNPTGMPLIKGNNISPTLGTSDTEEIKRIFHALAQKGEIIMALQKTFWSELYGMVTDQYGISWQLSHHGSEKQR